MKTHIKNTKPLECFSYFPLFINLSGRRIIVIGGGKIAERRIKALLEYNADITVVSPCIADAIDEIVRNGGVRHINRKYESKDVCGAFLTIAATNDKDVNRTVAEDARKSGSLVIVSDNREDCDCYFPAIVENDEFIAGIVSKNGNHTGLREKAREMRRFLNYEKDCEGWEP